jgi:hypothetical protein
MKETTCGICGALFGGEEGERSPFLEAGEFLAKEKWNDAGKLCPRCLESRALLTIMYDPEFS